MAVDGAVQAADLSFFTVLAAAGSLSAAARELGLTPAAVSKHLSAMERRAGVTLVNRTTRSMTLSPEGELYLLHARQILDDIETLAELLGHSKRQPKGLLRINATPGFGRNFIGPITSQYIALYPQMSVQLQLSATPPPVTDDAFDVCIRFGEPPDSRLVARRLAANRRLLCAAPTYLEKHGIPVTPADLGHHSCINIRQGEDAYGIWTLMAQADTGSRKNNVRVNGGLSTNDGEIAVKWALDGHGILMRAEWDIRGHLENGALVRVLPDYMTPSADIYAVYSSRRQLSKRIRTFVDFLAQRMLDMQQ